jgi:acetylornithine deacetylase/succinyl-diaminopimelate desuccinylase-like protein
VRERVASVAADARFRRALGRITASEAAIEACQIRLSLIPAPPFGEAARADAFAEELRRSGLNPILDAAGNVIAPYEGFGRNPVIVDAHLDTVFPASTPLELQRKGRIIHLPGIADNGSGMAALLGVLHAAREENLRFRRPVIFVGTVGEEGEGNLRGVRCLFETPAWPCEDIRQCEFIALDVGGAQRVTHQALGSRRIRIRMTGPGGHSWADFGRPNPIQALASAIHAFGSNTIGRRPNVSFNVGMMQAGIAVNAIPVQASAEVDLRATVHANLDDLHHFLQRSVNAAVAASGVECRMEIIGERPSGETPVSSALVQAAIEATRHLGLDPRLDVGSTNANFPISAGVPSIAIGAGGDSGNIHTPGEWFDPAERITGLQRLLLLVAALAGLD